MSSASSSVLRMGQGLGFGRVKRRTSSPGHFLWEWSSRHGSSSAFKRGRFRGEDWILAQFLGGCLSLRCCAWRVRVVVVLREGYAISVASFPSVSSPTLLAGGSAWSWSFFFSLFLFCHWLFYCCAFVGTF